MFRSNYDNTGVTVELRKVVESGVNVWDFDYPSFYEGDQKKAFEQKVLDHYWFRQIGQETVGRFLHYFRAKVREIMPYYIERYRSVELMHSYDDPLESYHLTETFEKTGSGSSTSKSEGSASGGSVRKFSDTPQGTIDNMDNHLTEGEKNDNNSSSNVTGEASSETTENYTMTRRGNIGVQPLGDEIEKLRKAFINVDMEVINELNDLFLMVY